MGRRPAFDLSQLATAGLSVVEREGWPSMSFRSVSGELGVSPMALYRLVADAERLRRLVADAASAPIQPDAGNESLLGALHAWAIDAGEHLARYPGLASYVIREWTELPGWLDIVETFLAHARSDGLSGGRAVATVNAVFAYVLSRAQLHHTASPRRALAPVRDDRGRYPLVADNRSEFTTARTRQHFEFGLDALIGGLQHGLDF